MRVLDEDIAKAVANNRASSYVLAPSDTLLA
jgi:hypothetical protein